MRDADLDGLYLMAERSYLSGVAETDPYKKIQAWENCVPPALAYVELGGKKNVHVYLNYALNGLGRIREALESCQSGLRISPEDPHLLNNIRYYAEFRTSD